MAKSNTPVTWDPQAREWDASMIAAMQERLHRENVISSDAATLFQATMKLGEEHPFGADEAGMLLDCWSIFVLRSNIPWHVHDANAPVEHFLPTIIASQPMVALDYLRERVHTRLSDRINHASWMLIATHLTKHLDPKVMVPEMESLVKTWSSNLRRNHDLAYELGRQGPYFPWADMKTIHQAWSDYPYVQTAIAQWDGLVCAEKVWLLSSEEEKKHENVMFGENGHSELFHTNNMQLSLAQVHIRQRWGYGPSSAGERSSRNGLAVHRMLSKVRGLVETYSEVEVPKPSQVIAGWCLDVDAGQHLNFTEEDAKLLGHTPAFQKMVTDKLSECQLAVHSVNPELFTILASINYPLVGHPKETLLADGAKEYLLNYAQKGGNAIITYAEVPAMLRCLTRDTLLGLGHSDDVTERQVFWLALDESHHLRPEVCATSVQEPMLQQSLLLMALMENHGVSHWEFPTDERLHAGDVMAVWYPEHKELWKHVQREVVRNPKTASTHLWNAVLQVQGIDPAQWDILQHMVEAPPPNKDARQAFSDFRSWNLGLPQSAPQMGWVLETLQKKTDDLSLTLPVLDDLGPAAV